MVNAIKPSGKLAKTAARNAALLLSLVDLDDEDSDYAPIWRFLALKTLDSQWTAQLVDLLSSHPDVFKHLAGVPLRGRRSDRGEFGTFHRELFAVLDRHCVTAVYLSSDGAFCPMRLPPYVLDVPVAGRAHRGRWLGRALCGRPGFESNFLRYVDRLKGATAKECCVGTTERQRFAELAAHKAQEKRIRQLVDDCCAGRRPRPRSHARRALAR